MIQLHLAVLGAAGLAALVSGPSAWAQSPATIKALTLPNLAKLEAESQNRPAPYDKIGSHLLDAIQAGAGPKSTVVGKALPAAKAEPQTGTLPVHIKADVTPGVLDAIAAAGGAVDATVPDARVIAAHVPANAVTGLAARSDVSSIELSAKVRSHATALPLGKALAANLGALSANLGVRGQKVHIGVIASSLYDSPTAADEAKRRFGLDMKTVPIVEDHGTLREGEGLAMLEVIHAVAPDAELMIDVVPSDDGAPVSVAIRKLISLGCNIIVDDLTVGDETPFGGGFLEKDVLAASQAGVLYFGAAGNNGNSRSKRSSTWEGPFTDGGAVPGAYLDKNGQRVKFEGHWNVFATAKGRRVTILNVEDHGGATYGAYLYWSDSPAHIVNQYNLYVIGGDHWQSQGLEGHIVGAGTSDRKALSTPMQYVENVQPGDSILVVQQPHSVGAHLHLEVDRQKLRYGKGGAVRGHATLDANTVFSIGAIAPPKAGAAGDESPVAEWYSSDGPRLTFFGPDGLSLNADAPASGVVHHKPDLVIADQLPISVRYLGDGPTNGVFTGTSAAAPEAAAIAALLLSCPSAPSPDAVATALRASARRVSADDFDPTFGYGAVVAEGAADRLACLIPLPTPPAAAALAPAEPAAGAALGSAGSPAPPTPAADPASPSG